MNHFHYPSFQKIHHRDEITVRRNQHSYIIRTIPSRAYEISCHTGIDPFFFSTTHIGSA